MLSSHALIFHFLSYLCSQNIFYTPNIAIRHFLRCIVAWIRQYLTLYWQCGHLTLYTKNLTSDLTSIVSLHVANCKLPFVISRRGEICGREAVCAVQHSRCFYNGDNQESLDCPGHDGWGQSCAAVELSLGTTKRRCI